MTSPGRWTRLLLLAALLPILNGCMVGYLVNSGYQQLKILNNREPIEKLLKDARFPEEKKRKLRLALDARKFAESEMGLKATGNYTTYVELDRPYVSYILSVAKAFELQPYLWNYPLVGRLPYKGYFSEKEARAAARDFKPEEYDTYVRGASAYSTLGWFDDPVLSSMLSYDDHDLVNLIIHESVHATLYIKSNADFNEQLATFVGDWGARRFFIAREGETSPTAKRIEAENRDNILFSEFLTRELKELEAWYAAERGHMTRERKSERLRALQTRFQSEVAPKLATDHYARFAEIELNNARLLAFQTYMQDLELFARMLEAKGGDIRRFMKFMRGLEKSATPKEDLMKALSHSTATTK